MAARSGQKIDRDLETALGRKVRYLRQNIGRDVETAPEKIDRDVETGPASSSAGSLSVTAASINLTKNLVGAGIFSLPAALLRGSVFPGLLVMVFVCIVQGGSFVLIAYLCQQLGQTTYRGIWAKAFGQRSASVVDVCIVINSFIACAAYNILIADFLEKALEGLMGWESAPRSVLIWVSTVTITLPLSHARDLSRLQYTSMLGLVIVALVWCYVVVDFLTAGGRRAIDTLAPHAFRLDVMGNFEALALCTGAFQAHYNSPRMFTELGSNLRAHTSTTVNSFGMALAIYTSFAIAGLGLFGDTVLGNLLRNYRAEGNLIILLSWLGMALATIFTYPLIFTTGRTSLIGLLPSLQRSAERSPSATHVALTSVLVALIAAIACTVEDVSAVTGLLGATIGSCLCWIFPACIYLKVTRRVSAHGNKVPLLKKSGTAASQLQGSATLRSCATCMVVVGALSMCAGVFQTLAKMRGQ